MPQPPIANTGRYLISYHQDAAALPSVIKALHTFAGIAPSAVALDTDHAPVDVAGAVGTLSDRFGLGVVSLPDDAIAKLQQQSGAIERVRPERYFTPPPFRPQPVNSLNLHAMEFLSVPAISPTLEDKFTWGLQALGVGSTSFTGKGVRVAVLDSGIWLQHKDFAARATSIETAHFAPGILDAHDDYGHGTFCAGIIAGPVNPSNGPRYGVAPDVELFVGRILDTQQRAREYDIIQAINWAIDKKCRIVSLSCGALPDTIPDPDYERVGAEAMRQGCLIIAAAGNDSARPHRAPVRMPANSTSVLGVAALTMRRGATNNSNAGVYPENGGAVDLSGPGSDIYSAGHTSQMPYVREGGTSAATPFVAGAAAQILEQDSSLSAARLWTKLLALCAGPPDPTAETMTPTDVGVGLVQVPTRA